MALIGIFTAVVLISTVASNSTVCYSSGKQYDYLTFEELVLTDGNLENLTDAFFPTNHHRSVVVNVTYQFYNPDESKTPNTLTFQWLSSPIHLFINSQLLSGLSLRTYATEYKQATLTIKTCSEVDIATLQNLISASKLNCSSNQILSLLNKASPS